MNNKLKNKRGGAFALAVLSAFCIMASALPALAGDQMQSDTNSLAVSSTNVLRLLPDVSGTFTNGEAPGNAAFIICAKADDVWLECGGVFTNTTAGASNILFRIAGSVSGNQWTNNFATLNVVVPASSTNYASAVQLIQNAPTFLALRSIDNTNGAAVTGRKASLYLKAYTKDGI